MCLNPRLIINPKLDPTGIDKPNIKVHCGHCPECRKEKSNEWFVRTYYEVFGDGVHKDIFLVTLDFDNEHLPLYKAGVGLLETKVPYRSTLDFDNLPDDVQPCFDNQEVRAFLDRLRYYVPPFRYLCVAEYGGFLRRPHHHLLFIFPKWALMDKMRLLYFVGKCWRSGKMFDVGAKYNINDPIKMIQYVVKYVTKDYTFDLEKSDKNLPYRYRPRVLPSGHFGHSAIEMGIITYDKIKNDGVVLINGFRYKIPRYYEQKFCYDYYWDKEEKKALRPINQLGKELNQYRHNCHYVNYVKEFHSSRLTPIHLDSSVSKIFYKFFPDSPYNGCQWRDIVQDVMSDYDSFVDFCRIKDFIFLSKGSEDSRLYRPYVKYFNYLPAAHFAYRHILSIHGDNVETAPVYECRSQSEDGDSVCRVPLEYNLIAQACFMYDLYRMKEKEKQLFVKLYEESENQKKRAWNKIRGNPRLCRYLHAKNFDFRKLYRMSFHDFYSLNIVSYVQRSKIETY